MNKYTPDCWVIIEINNPQKNDKLCKVFGGWDNSAEESWRINSGIAEITQPKKSSAIFHFHGYTGSVYECNIHDYGLNDYMKKLYENFHKVAKAQGVLIRCFDFSEAHKYISDNLEIEE